MAIANTPLVIAPVVKWCIVEVACYKVCSSEISLKAAQDGTTRHIGLYHILLTTCSNHVSVRIQDHSLYQLAFSALTLLAGRQEEQPLCKNWVVRCWRGYLPGMRCRWFANYPADATVTPSSLASLPFWCRLIKVVLEKKLLNRCLSSRLLEVMTPFDKSYMISY